MRNDVDDAPDRIAHTRETSGREIAVGWGTGERITAWSITENWVAGITTSAGRATQLFLPANSDATNSSTGSAARSNASATA